MSCGTAKGYLQHKARNEPPCKWCVKAVTAPAPAVPGSAAPKRRRTSTGVRQPSTPGVKPPCGTKAGYGWHMRNGGNPDDACRKAAAAYARERYKPSTRVLVQCGTNAGRRKHRRDGTPMCEPCRLAAPPPRPSRAKKKVTP